MVVTANPGFAPESDVPVNGFSYEYDGKYYADINGLFNDNYAHLKYYRDQGYTEYYHEGVDFYGTIGTKVVALIYAKVLAYGVFGNYGNTMILANRRAKGVYLLAHLSNKRNDLRKDSFVEPHDIVAYVGNTGAASTGAHLHLSYYDYEYEGNFDIVKEENGILSWINWNPNNYLTDPFTHNGIRRAHKK